MGERKRVELKVSRACSRRENFTFRHAFRPENKPFRSAISNTALLSSSEKVKAQTSLYLIAKKWLNTIIIQAVYCVGLSVR